MVYKRKEEVSRERRGEREKQREGRRKRTHCGRRVAGEKKKHRPNPFSTERDEFSLIKRPISAAVTLHV
jgi:hypothetical protein